VGWRRPLAQRQGCVGSKADVLAAAQCRKEKRGSGLALCVCECIECFSPRGGADKTRAGGWCVRVYGRVCCVMVAEYVWAAVERSAACDPEEQNRPELLRGLWHPPTCWC
jgi:hypothetical protein